MENKVESSDTPVPKKSNLSPRAPSSSLSGMNSAGISQSVLPSDFPLWKLALPAGALLGGGVYVGYRREILDMTPEEEALFHSKSSIRKGATRVALRAFMYGSALAVGCTSAAVIVTAHLMDVKNVREFADKMKIWTPKQMKKLGYRHAPQLIEDEERIKSMTHQEEWEYIQQSMGGGVHEAVRDARQDQREKDAGAIADDEQGLQRPQDPT